MSVISARRTRRRKLKSEINVVPYIDVMLVLLVIFMITAPLLNLGVEVDLPDSQARSLQQKSDPVVVSVDAAGNLFLAAKAGSNEAVSADTLTAKVRAIVNQRKDVQVLVAGDGKASYQSVNDVIGLLQSAGVDKVSLVSVPKAGAAR